MKVNQCAAFMKAHREDIFSTWEQRSNEEVLAAAKTDDLIVRNYLSYFMDALIDVLENYDESAGEEQLNNTQFDAKYSEEHGRSRATLQQYNISQVMQEYAILRQVIRQKLKDNDLLCFTTLEILDRFIEDSSMSASQLFTDSVRQVQNKLISVIAHDLRNPVSIARSYIEAGESGLMDTPEVYGTLKRNLDRALKLITELLDTNQVEAGSGMTFRFKEVNLSDEIAVTCEDANEIHSNTIIYNREAESSDGTFDQLAIQRVVENLISNAIKYGSTSGDITITLAQKHDDLLLSVHNTGSFIEEQDQKSIFNYFSRENGNHNRSKQGWGLGLYLVKMVAQAHNGKAWVESDRELGTTFYIQLAKESHPAETAFSHVL